MAGPFICSTLLSCKCINGGVYGEFLVGYCSQVNCSGIVQGCGSFLGCWRGLQERKVILANVGSKCIFGIVFSEKYSRGHGSFKVIIDGIYGVFIIDN